MLTDSFQLFHHLVGGDSYIPLRVSLNTCLSHQGRGIGALFGQTKSTSFHQPNNRALSLPLPCSTLSKLSNYGATNPSCILQKRDVSISAARQQTVAGDPSYGGKRIIRVTEPVYDYILAHTREPEVLAKLRNETAAMVGSGMQVSPEQGQFLSMLAKLMRAERCIEVGVFTGYSAISVALALPPNGRLVACDRVEYTMDVARRYFHLAGVENKIDVRLGVAQATLTALLENAEEGSYDFAFLDADKRSYPMYYELLLQLLRPGGLLVVDNVLWHGDVAEPNVTDAKTVSLRHFNDFVMADSRVDVSMVPIGDGMTLCHKI